jgi:crotonobetainyl-CoA hydratase
MNSIDEASEAELIRIWRRSRRTNTVRCVVVTGAGEPVPFCTGADMKQSGNKTGLEYWGHTRIGAASAACRCAIRSTCPVVARVNGPQRWAAAWRWCWAADIVVAAENATYRLSLSRASAAWALEGGMPQLPA